MALQKSWVCSLETKLLRRNDLFIQNICGNYLPNSYDELSKTLRMTFKLRNVDFDIDWLEKISEQTTDKLTSFHQTY